MTITNILGFIFILAMLGMVVLHIRFLRIAKQSGLFSKRKIESLSLLVSSGDDATGSERWAFAYMLERRYVKLGDISVTRAGDAVLYSFYTAFGLMVLCVWVSIWAHFYL